MLIFTFIFSILSVHSFSDDIPDTKEEKTKRSSKSKKSSKPEISSGSYIAGGVVGSIIGLGIGHGIQGRYLPKGLMFTLAEGAGIGLAIAGYSALNRGVERLSFDQAKSGYIMYIAGISIFAGFRIAEIVSVWTGARIKKSEDEIEETTGIQGFYPIIASTGKTNFLGVGFQF